MLVSIPANHTQHSYYVITFTLATLLLHISSSSIHIIRIICVSLSMSSNLSLSSLDTDDVAFPDMRHNIVNEEVHSPSTFNVRAQADAQFAHVSADISNLFSAHTYSSSRSHE